VKFDAIEAGGLSALGGGGEQRRQRFRQVTNMRQFDVNDALAIALHERFELARGQRLSPTAFAQREQTRPHLGFARALASDRTRCSLVTCRKRSKNFAGSGRRRIARKSMI
jgi:hypothetical protein